MEQPSLSWIGLHVDESLIADIIAEQPLTWTYLAQNAASGAGEWIKVAKPAIDEQPRLDIFAEGVWVRDGGRWAAAIDGFPAFDLVRGQGAWALMHEDPAVISVKSVVVDASLPYLRTAKPAGESFRQLVQERSVQAAHIDLLLSTLANLEKRFGRDWHGNLNASGIWFDASDCDIGLGGYFGYRSGSRQAAVTTPAYYPFLEPDDCLAVGLLCCEALLEVHPMHVPTSDPRYIQLFALSDDLQSALQELTSSSGPWFANFRPGKFRSSQASAALEDWLMKSIRLCRNADGKLETDVGFQNFTEMLTAFREVIPPA